MRKKGGERLGKGRLGELKKDRGGREIGGG